jgi:predicted RNase H-like nuclease
MGKVTAWICGVDGSRDKWCVVFKDLATGHICGRVVPLFSDLLRQPESPLIVAVDVPIGLPDVTLPKGRLCERLARPMVGRQRACSVFSAVGRKALEAQAQPEANRLNRAAGGIGIGAQAWGLASKLRHADAIMTPALQRLVYEVHPEISFRWMTGSVLNFGKKKAAGQQEREQALIAAGFSKSHLDGLLTEVKAARDDVFDACAALWTAERIYRGDAERIPDTVHLDVRGLDMAIWY